MLFHHLMMRLVLRALLSLSSYIKISVLGSFCSSFNFDFNFVTSNKIKCIKFLVSADNNVKVSIIIPHFNSKPLYKHQI